jgi:nicotinate-nucleotide--dimethylbenzimidazole phosphoribosyltransferase
MQPTSKRPPFEDIRDLLTNLPAPDEASADLARRRDADLTKPPGSLGRLEEIAVWLAAWQGRYPPRIDRPVVAVFAGNHGVAGRGVSAYPAEVTRQMVANFQSGGAAINQLCRASGAGLKVFELALEMPTGDIAEEDALDEAGCAATIAYGMEAVAGEADLLGIGEMGIGNTTVAAALAFALFGGDVEDWVGRGTGVDDSGLKRKHDAVFQAVSRLKREHGEAAEPLTVLRSVGGRELAAMVGAILAARYSRVPVLIDGYVASAAAAVVHALDPGALDHCMFAHRSSEQAHGRLLAAMGKTPLFDFGMRLGEGSGAALAIGIVRAAVEVHTGMSSFSEAGVSKKDEKPE